MDSGTTAPELARLTADPRQWALFLDFDGTLVDLAPTPDAIRVPPELPGLLRALSELYDGALAIMTGRGLADLDSHLGGLRFPAAGQHGAERRIDPRQPARPPDAKLLAAARERLAAFANDEPGVLIEDKGGSIALHFRAAPAAGPAVRRIAERLVAEAGGALDLMPGKCVLEIKSAGADKGGALEAFLEEPPFRGRRPLVLGDDRTDEAAFAVALRSGGAAVKVGVGPTRARWRLGDPRAVRNWLARHATAQSPA